MHFWSKSHLPSSLLQAGPGSPEPNPYSSAFFLLLFGIPAMKDVIKRMQHLALQSVTEVCFGRGMLKTLQTLSLYFENGRCVLSSWSLRTGGQKSFQAAWALTSMSWSWETSDASLWGVMCSAAELPQFRLFTYSVLWNILRLCLLLLSVVIISFFLNKSWNTFFPYISTSDSMTSYTLSLKFCCKILIFH